ncbi:Ig-like domain-containing protein [Neobacillus sp.]|uniref:Ig-like domain-containing protein n=1 Tax=Neobacillus sp. TaxID=2675273 RepID=UPI00289C9731|nr:Ig-like domain-containing protein [Neobacillus sp.]
MKSKSSKKISLFLVFMMLFSIVSPNFALNSVRAATFATDLIFSEYVEGSGNNKALEIYNGTGKAVDLSAYTIELYTNGSSTVSSKLTLGSINLANGATYVIVHGSSGTELKPKGNTTNSTVMAFNGNDAIVLKKGTTVIDSIGQIGKDPGAAGWGTTVKTTDQTLVRKSNITSGDTNPNDAFIPELEWNGYLVDTFTYLGSHTMDLETAPTKVDIVTSNIKSGKVPSGTAIQLSTLTAGATIYYTTNGDTPSKNSTPYTAPIVIKQDTTIKALATANGSDDSDIATFVYTILDEIAPDAPIVNPVTDADLVIKGTAEAGATVVAKVNGNEIGRTTADQSGKFEITIANQAAGVKISVTATDAAGNVSEATEVIVTDVTAPAAPVVNPVTDTDEVITGTAELGTTVIAKVNDQVIGKATTDTKGQFQINVTKQAAGTIVSVSAEDAFGNISSAKEVTVISDISKVDSVTLSVSHSSPQNIGTSVTLKALAVGSLNPEYRFYISENGSLTTLQEYSSNDTVTWTPTKSGTYKIIVHAKNKNKSGANYFYEARTEMNYEVEGNKVTHVSVSTNVTAPQVIGTPITIKASSKGSLDPEYRFYISENGSLTTLQEYRSNDSVTWTPSKSGIYKIIVHAKDKSKSGANYFYEARTEMIYEVYGDKVTSVNVSTNVTTPQVIGTPITINASSKGSLDPEYRFYILENGTLTILQEYDNNDTITWTPTKSGTYKIIVHAKDKSKSGANYFYEARTEMNYEVYGDKVTSVNVSTDVITPQLIGIPIKINASSKGSLNPEYRFYISENGILTTLQEYDRNDTITWTPTKSGSYKIIVHAKDKNKFGDNYFYEARTEMNYEVYSN